MKKIFLALAIIYTAVYMIGCIGLYDNGEMTITALLGRAVVAVIVECVGFYLIDKDEKGERDDV